MKQSAGAGTELPASLRPKPPDLNGLEITIPRPRPAQPDELVQRFEQLRVTHATRTPLAVGAEVKVDDEVTADVVAYDREMKVPQGGMEEARFLAGEETIVPGLGVAVTGHKVGERFTSPGFKIHLKAASRLQLPGVDENFLHQVDRGATIPELLESLAAEATQEQLAALEEDATRGVLQAVAQRTKLEIPENLIDLEIAWSWRAGQDAVLSRLGLSMEERNAALKARLNDSAVRQEAKQRISVTLTLRAVAEANGLQVTAKESNKANGSSELSQALESDAVTKDQTLQRLTHLRAVGFVMSRVKVRVS
jgi:trigger factor